MKAGKFLKYLVLTVVAVNVAIIAVMFLGSASNPKPMPMPDPNGYDDFVRAGYALNGDVTGYANKTRGELANIILANAEALRILHQGMTRESLVPNDYAEVFPNRMMNDLAKFRSLIFLLCAEGRLAEMDGRTNDSVKIYLDGIRFADGSGRGGVFMYKLVSIACEAIAMKPLASLKPSLDAKKCEEIVAVLEEIDAKADPVETILGHEKAFGRKIGGLQGQLAQLVMYKTMRAANQKLVDKIQANTLKRRQAMVSFAARAYELEKGKAPASVADLVPAYLKAVPQDPVTKTNLTYVP